MYIVFDIGGTKMRIAGSRDSKEFSADPIIIETPHNYDEGIVALRDAIEIAAAGEQVVGIVGGVAGPFGEQKGSLLSSPNLSGWIGKPLRDDLADTYNAPVHIENDSALVGLGEMHYGAGVSEGIGSYITVSTGVGGARYVDGEIDRATIGFEPGHQIIDADKTLCPDCSGPTLGNYISGKGTEKRLQKSPKDISQNDPLWEDYARYLAYGLHNTILHWSPEVVVLGGSMIVGDPSIPLMSVKSQLEEICTIFPELPAIKVALLGDKGGLYGGLVLLRQHSA